MTNRTLGTIFKDSEKLIKLKPSRAFVTRISEADNETFNAFRREINKNITVGAETLDLGCAILTKSLAEDTSPFVTIDTIRYRPTILKKTLPCGLKRDERLLVCGEGVEHEDLRTLHGKQWLNDKVLNAYIKLVAREANDYVDRPNAFVVPTYTASLWDNGIYDNHLFRKVDFSLYKYILVPWNRHGNHWVLLVADNELLTVNVLDSMGGDNQDCIERFCKFMKNRSASLNTTDHHWQAGTAGSNRQSYGSSCGVFTLMNAECLLSSVPVWILQQHHVPMFRKYVKERLLQHGDRYGDICNALPCQVPSGDQEWIQCDICGRWLHVVCCMKDIDRNSEFSCNICNIQYS